MARTAAVSCSRAVAARTRLRGTSARTHIETISRHRKTFAALMPLLHQDTRRGGGGTSRHRHSLSEYIVSSFDYLQPETANTPKSNRRANDGEAEREWRWDEPASPELAQTPRALVPNACFPPRQQRAFASYSENARPGSGWSDETNGQGMNGLITSLKGLAMPAPSSALSLSNSSYDGSDKTMVESPWPPEQARWPPEQADNAPQDRPGGPNRRASFCGVMSSRSNGREALRWSGTVPPRCTDPSGGFSAKVFLGGLPWDMSETALMHTLRQFSPVRVEWPGRDGGGGSPRGYAYVTFESECCVRALLCASRRDRNDWYYRMGARKMRTKEVQVIPWAVSDSNWVVGGSVRLEPARTVFVGALHGMLSASALAAIMSDLFSGVVYAGIDTDKHKYPIGSGRVTFNNVSSYVRAISAGHVEIHTDKFTKKVQVDPYLEDSMCSVCNLHQGPYFCREPICFRYYCRSCWSWQHRSDEHRVLVRNSKSALPAAAPAMPDEHAPTNGHAAAYIGHGSGEGDTPSPTDSGASGASPSASTSASEPDSGLEHDLRSLV